MAKEHSTSGHGAIGDPRYLRAMSARLGKIIETLADPEIKRELAAHSLQLAMHAEAIARSTEDQAIIEEDAERYGAMLGTPRDDGNQRTIQALLDDAEKDQRTPRTLRELAVWYRGFAERAENPAIWEARLRMAEDLEAEAVRLAGRGRRLDNPAET